jgi:hypothetical protein
MEHVVIVERDQRVHRSEKKKKKLTFDGRGGEETRHDKTIYVHHQRKMHTRAIKIMRNSKKKNLNTKMIVNQTDTWRAHWLWLVGQQLAEDVFYCGSMLQPLCSHSPNHTGQETAPQTWQEFQSC